ncbi:mitochondrial carrier protein [Lithospermum erythrorhizon]|uniref:Mitochondrial carrier protein n=1 Tax=Lithospermum erythrorhizon TaxID=34254 RepID=A0AAV3PXV7_LITER
MSLVSLNSQDNYDFFSNFGHLNALLLSSLQNPPKSIRNTNKKVQNLMSKRHNFSSTSISIEAQIPNQEKGDSSWLKTFTRDSLKFNGSLKNLYVHEKALIGAASGGFAGGFTHMCLHPLDTIKTKLQTKGATEMYNRTFDAIVQTFKNEGILGFYRGVSAAIIGSSASSAVYFGTCEFGKSLLSKIETFPPLLIPPIAGAMGNIASSALMVPKELITQRMQAGAKGKSWELILTILKKDGIMGLYTGYGATLLRNLPTGVLNYSTFEYLKAGMLRQQNKEKLEGYENVFCGAMAGAVSASLTTPLDVLKTRMMTRTNVQVVNKVGAVMYDGIQETLKQILKKEGWVGLTRGMGLRILQNACFSAIGFFAFETARVTILNEYLKCKQLQNVDSKFIKVDKLS